VAEIGDITEAGCIYGAETLGIAYADTTFVKVASNIRFRRGEVASASSMDDLDRVVTWGKQVDNADKRRLAIGGAVTNCDACDGQPLAYTGSTDSCRLKAIMEAIRTSRDTYETDELEDIEDLIDLPPWYEEAIQMYPDGFNSLLDEPIEGETIGLTFYDLLADEFIKSNYDIWEPITSRTVGSDGLVLIDDLILARDLSKTLLKSQVAERAMYADEDNGNEEQLRLLIGKVKDLRAKAEQKAQEKVRYDERRAAETARVAALRAANAETNPELA